MPSSRPNVAWTATNLLPSPLPTRLGHDLAGWNTAADGSGTAVTAATPYSALVSSDTVMSATIYAQWTPKTGYTVHYDANGGVAGTMPPSRTGVTWTTTGLPPVAPNLPTRTGYDLAGWNTAADGSGTAVTAATAYSALVSGDTVMSATIYAQWTPKTGYTVNYNANGGVAGIMPPNRTGVTWTTTGLPPVAPNLPTRPGHDLAGWNTAADGSGTAVTAATAYSALVLNDTTMSTTLYAQWTARGTYTVNYDANGGVAGGMPSSRPNVAWTATNLLPSPLPTRLGHDLAGWNTAADGSGTSAVAATAYSALVPNDTTMSVTLYAQWTPKTGYTVNYSANGGVAGTMPPSRTGVTWTTTGLPPVAPNLPTRSGYDLAGWNTAADGSGTSAVAATAYSALVPNDTTMSITLYAQWTLRGNYTVNYDANGGVAGTMPPSRTGVAWTTTGLPPVAPNLPTRTGHDLAGWNTAADGSGTAVTAATAYSALVSSDTVMSATIYAQWTLRSNYTVNYNANGGVAGTMPPSRTGVAWTTTGLPPVAPNLPTRTGYNLAGWNTAANGSGTAVTASTAYSALVSGDTVMSATIYAQWTARSDIKVTFDKNTTDTVTGPTPAEQNVTFAAGYGTLATISRTGYDFDGWYTAATGGTQVTDATMVSNANDHILYARWSAMGNIRVTFDRNTTDPVTGPTPAEKRVAFDAAYGALATISRVGYDFDGWYTAPTGGTQVTATTMVSNANDHAVYARWAVKWHNIAYRYASTPAGAPTLPADQSTAYNTPQTVWQPVPDVITGYTFGGWTASGVSQTSGTFTMPDNAVTFTGSWVGKPVELRFYNNHDVTDPSRYAAAETANAGRRYNETLATFAAPTRHGYDLDGWFTSRSGGTRYIPGVSVIDTEGPLELYANWSLKQIEVRFYLNYSATDNARYAVGEAANAGKQYSDTLSAFADPVRDRYTFAGWFSAREGGVEYVPGTSVIDTNGTLNLYARWISDYAIIRYRANNWEWGSTSPGSEEIHKITGVPQGSTASPAPGYIFVNWTDSQGRILSTDETFVPNTMVGGVNVDTTFTANFREMDHVTVHFVARAGGWVYPTVWRGNPVTGQPVRSMATPNAGYEFFNWTDARGNVVGTGITYRPTKAAWEVWENGLTFYANFTPSGVLGAEDWIDIPVHKVWTGVAGAPNLPSVTVTLHRDGVVYRTLRLSSGNWSGVFANVPLYAPDGRPYTYSVTEGALPGFSLVRIAGTAQTGFTITNAASGLLNVYFIDWDGKLLKHQQVAYGASATPPVDPERPNHLFKGWNSDYTSIVRNIYIRAQYDRLSDGLGFMEFPDIPVPLAGGSISSFGDTLE